jgi:probable rRNA maturation factor
MSGGMRPARRAAAGEDRKAQRNVHGGLPRLTLSVQFGVPATGLPARSTLRRWAAAALERRVRVTLRFVGEAEGRRLNQQFRGKGHATNVLTFVYDEGSHDAPRDAPLAGDIVICVPVVRREAKAAGRALRAHFAHLVVHGLLHLQGYDHERDDAAAAMERRETDVLRRLRYPDPHAVE